MKKVFITGVAGMIGSHLLDALINRDYKIVGVDNLAVGKKENIGDNLGRSNFSFHQVDILNYEVMRYLGRNSDIIVHLAATKKIGEDGNGIDTLRVNTKGTEHVLEIARECGAKVILGSSSDVYGMSPELPLREDGDLLLGPSMIKRWSYAVSKLYDEQLAFSYFKDFGVPIVVLRYFGGFSCRASFTWSSGHIPLFIDAVLRDQEVIIHGDGAQTRSMGYVTDLVDGTVLAMEKEEAIGEIINIGNDEEVSVLDSAHIIHRLVNKMTGLNRTLKIKYVPLSAIFGKYKDIMRRIPDLTKAKRILGYEPKLSFEDGLRMTIKEHMDVVFGESHSPRSGVGAI